MNSMRYEKDGDNIITLTIDMEGPVNVLNKTFYKDFQTTVDRLVKERDTLKGVIVASAKKTFFAGADLNDFITAKPEDAPALFEENAQAKKTLRQLETLGKPVVAAINGTALGGGFEICLACHYRIAQTDKKMILGFPESGLGILPGAGGMVRSIHLVGLEKILPLILAGKPLSPEKACELGLIHALAPSNDDMLVAAKKWIHANPDAKQPWDEENHCIPGGDLTNPKVENALIAATVDQFKRSRDLLPAQKSILHVAGQILRVDFDTAQKIESREATYLLTSTVAKNLMQTFFFTMQDIKSGKNRPKDIEKMPTKKLGVLGAGTMGSGIAYVSAFAGIDVVLKDINKDAANLGKAKCEKILENLVKVGKIDAGKQQSVLDRITPTDTYDDLAGCDLIIEGIYEDVALKHKIIKEAEPQLSDDGFFGSNTSSLPITLLATASQQPDNFMGIHFFSPVHKMPLVEIIVGEKTSKQAIAKAYDYCQQIAKIPIVVNDSPAFFTSRVFETFSDEAVRLLQEGVHPLRIDRLATAIGYPVGPLALNDATSLTLTFKIWQANQMLETEHGIKSPLDNEVGARMVQRMTEEFNRGGRAFGGGLLRLS